MDVDRLLTKSAYYRQRATSVREIADGVPDETARATLLAVAEDYEHLAAAQEKLIITGTAPRPSKGPGDA